MVFYGIFSQSFQTLLSTEIIKQQEIRQQQMTHDHISPKRNFNIKEMKALMLLAWYRLKLTPTRGVITPNRKDTGYST